MNRWAPFPSLCLPFLVIVGLFFGMLAPVAEARNVIMRVGNVAAPTEIINLSLREFSETLKERSNGTITVRLYPNSQLGGELEMVQQVSAGLLEVVATAVTGYSGLDGWYAPFVFESQEHLNTVLANGILDPFFEQYRQDQGLRLLGWLARNPRVVTAKRPITDVSDLNGLRLRVPQIEILVHGFRAAGVRPTPLAFPELFQALQTGVVEAQENPVELLLTSKFYEVQDYIILTNHVFSPYFLYVNDRWWQGLIESQRELIASTLQETMAKHEGRVEAERERMLEELVGYGMQVIEPDRESMRRVIYLQGSKPWLERVWGAEIVAEVEAAAQ